MSHVPLGCQKKQACLLGSPLDEWDFGQFSSQLGGANCHFEWSFLLLRIGTAIPAHHLMFS